MNVTLVNTPIFSTKTPPLALGILAAVLKREAVNVKLLDLNIKYCKEIMELFNKRKIRLGKLRKFGKEYVLNSIIMLMVLDKKEEEYGVFKKVYKKIKDDLESLFGKMCDEILATSPDVVGFSVLAFQLSFSLMLAKLIKERRPNCKVILGGADMLFSGNKIMETFDFVDFVSKNEGENMLPAFVRALKHGNYEKVPGLLFRKKGKIIENPRKFVKDLDEVPFPNYDGLDLMLYNRGEPIFFIEGSRGCLYRCAFCSHPFVSPKFRHKSAKRVVDEMEYLQRKYGANYFFFSDSFINFDRGFLRELAEELIKRDLKVRWCATAKPLGIDEELARLLRKSNCVSLQFGVETGSDKVMKDMNKGTTVKIAEETLRTVHKAGIVVSIYLIVSFPTERLIDLLKTFLFVLRNRKFIYLTSVAYFQLVMFSPVYNDPTKYGIKKVKRLCPYQKNVFDDFFFVKGHEAKNELIPRRALRKLFELLSNAILTSWTKKGIDVKSYY